MPFQEQIQFTFQGVDAVSPEHAIPDNHVVTATNIDFGAEPGAATIRRGSNLLWTVGSSPVRQIWRRYVSPIGSSPFYVQVGSNVVRLVNGNSTTLSADGISGQMGISSYRDHVYISLDSGPNSIRDNGTSTTAWVKQGPTTAPSVQPEFLPPLSVVSDYTISEGTGTSSLGTATATTDSASGRLQLNGILTTTNLNVNLGNSIDDYGIDYVTLRFDDPAHVKRISKDYSLGDSSFKNYYHAEIDVILSEEALPSSEELIDSLLTKGTNTSGGVDEDTRAAMTAWVRTALRAPRSRISAAKDSDNVWAIARTNFEFVGSDSNVQGWDNVQACRIVVEAYGSVTVIVKDWQIKGASTYPLNDVEVGYSYWETYAKIDSLGGVSDESAPSPPSTRVKMQHGRAIVTLGTNVSDGDYTYRVIWRQGGYLRSPYPVGTIGISTNTFIDNLSDMTVLSNRREMPLDLLRNSEFPNNIVTISEPFKDRIFIGFENKIRWCKPGNPGAWPRLSEATVSHSEDKIQKIIVWGRLVIVNRDSVYEMDGNIFEGNGQDWVLQRSGSRRGSFAPNTIIKTPYGILLLDWDGIYLYTPGQGIDVDVSWANEKLSDAFKGSGSTDPAALKGNRIPAINLSYLQNASAEWANEKLYLAVPTGGSQYADVLFVLDFASKQVWWYQYPFLISSLFWDRDGNKLLAGTVGGNIIRLETRDLDSNDYNATVPIPWSIKTRLWTSPMDAVHENLSIEHNIATNGFVTAIYDSTNTVSLGSLSSPSLEWFVPPLNGVTARSVQFHFYGTKTGTSQQSIKAVTWLALIEPPRVQYFKTDYFDNNYPGEKYWDIVFVDMEIVEAGQVYGTVYIDGNPITTGTFSGPTLGKRTLPISLPVETYGNTGYVVYTASGNTYFKHWETRWGARNEPPRVNVWKTDPQSLDENIIDAFDVDMNPNGTALGTIYVDNVPVHVGTFVGTKRQSFTEAVPNYTYGRTLYVVYSGNGLKHYNTWFHARQEPDRWTNYVSDKVTGNEKEWRTFEYDIDIVAGTSCIATVYVDSAPVATIPIQGGTGRHSGVKSLPAKTFGRTIWAEYNCSPGGKAKHYRTWFEGTDEPDRTSVWRVGPIPLPSNHTLRTWIPVIDPLGNQVVGTLIANGAVISTSTFSGNNGRSAFPIELEFTGTAINEASQLEAVYTSTGVFKHYDTKFETMPKPFGKKSWLFRYSKVGGASQLDIARFWSIDAEIPGNGTATLTCTWEVDNYVHQTDVLTLSGRQWKDRIPFLPGARGKLFQLRISSAQNFEVYRVNIDTIRVGVKGLSRISAEGTPMEQISYIP